MTRWHTESKPKPWTPLQHGAIRILLPLSHLHPLFIVTSVPEISLDRECGSLNGAAVRQQFGFHTPSSSDFASAATQSDGSYQIQCWVTCLALVSICILNAIRHHLLSETRELCSAPYQQVSNRATVRSSVGDYKLFHSAWSKSDFSGTVTFSVDAGCYELFRLLFFYSSTDYFVPLQIALDFTFVHAYP